jgi:anti-anti-sigma factor
VNPRGFFSGPLKIAVEAAGSINIVCVSGSTGLPDGEALRQKLIELIQPQNPSVLLDLSHLTFINSAGIGALVAAHQRARAMNGEIRAVQPTESVARLLHLMKIDTLIPTHATREHALEAFRA